MQCKENSLAAPECTAREDQVGFSVTVWTYKSMGQVLMKFYFLLPIGQWILYWVVSIKQSNTRKMGKVPVSGTRS